MFGSHLSVAGGLHNALIQARSLRMDCVQVFTRNQRQWRALPLTDEQVNLWRSHVRQTGVSNVVSHDSYLINLASPVNELRNKSTSLYRQELLRCEALGIRRVVMHPGSYIHGGPAAGLRRVALALNRVHRSLPGLDVVTCLEVTAGQGTGLGWRFEHLRRIIDQTRQPERLAICLDTAHLLAAGYDLTSAEGAAATLDECDQVLGLDNVAVIHLNDSKTPRGGRTDRHEHIGRGHISRDAFRVFVTHSRFARIPKILETPKGEDLNGVPWDAINLRAIRRLARPVKPRRAPKRHRSAKKRPGG